jgi:hypothetical protein
LMVSVKVFWKASWLARSCCSFSSRLKRRALLSLIFLKSLTSILRMILIFS